MDIKGELIEAQFEVRETTTQVLALPPIHGRIVYSIEDGHTWIGNGTMWKKNLQKEDQFLDFPLGHVSESMLTEPQFQSEMGTLKGSAAPDLTWAKMDGRDVTGSDYHTLTGNTTIPDMVTGKRFLRQTDIDGNLGTVEAESFKAHTHQQQMLSVISGSATGGFFSNMDPASAVPYGVSTTSSGGAETRPNNIWVNYFIKINRTIL